VSNFRSIQLGELLFESVVDQVVATGSTQANAFVLPPAEMIRLTSVAAGTGIKLPPAQPGLCLLVVNHGANPVQVYGQAGDTINDVASATGVSQMQNSFVFYSCFTTGLWYTEGLANGFSSGFQTFSSVDNIIAHAGGGQGSATPLTAMQNLLGTVASGGDSVILPSAKVGMQLDVVNKTATSANVFPATGETINGQAANTAVAVAGGAQGSVTVFFCGTAGAWWTK
jgi:hypothetical protein